VRVGPEIMTPWCDSLKTCGVTGLILYDELPADLLTAREGIAFVKTACPPAGMSLNDWRFFAYRALLRERPDITAAFFTDLFDMLVQHDPFPWLQQMGGMAFGVEDKIDQGPWMTERLKEAFGANWTNRMCGDWPRCTAGLFGGPVGMLLPLLDIICGILDAVHQEQPALNANMAAFQMAIHAGLCGRKIHFGKPLHAPDWRWGGRDRAAFFHHEWRELDSPLFS
jgi:hypothetical protein